MNFGRVLDIQDLGRHSVGTVVELAILLAGTVDVTPDPNRVHFYEIENGPTVYYVCVSPVSGKVFLVAAWDNVASSQRELHMADSAWS
ncbi:MAG: hypothetical protein WCC21_09950 [Candidatus Acidiferrales bacterium]